MLMSVVRGQDTLVARKIRTVSIQLPTMPGQPTLLIVLSVVHGTMTAWVMISTLCIDRRPIKIDANVCVKFRNAIGSCCFGKIHLRFNPCIVSKAELLR